MIRARPPPWPAALAVLAVLGAAPAGAADVFSPGELSQAHEKLEGLSNCTKCHAAGEQLSPDKCLECHAEIRIRMSAGKGFHGRLEPGARACEQCHHEHQGRDFAIVDWGEGGQRKFDHARIGYPLRGKHAPVECAACHDSRRVADQALRELVGKGRKTLLGAPVACSACHFDEHRGQMGQDCKKCHNEQGWKPAPGFDHGKTAYPLRGKHARVACDKCHAKAAEAVPVTAGALLQPKSASWLRYKPVSFETCLDCHKDPHQNRFGQDCQKCHTVEDWRKVMGEGAGERAFHQKARYPLTGGHAQVACQACHGPWPGQRAIFKGLAFEACTDCHADAHVGQMARRGHDACDQCHTVQGYKPARFGLAEHARTRYPLEGAHRVVACSTCHPQDPRVAERFPAAVRRDLERKKRPVKVSSALYDIGGDTRRCDTCHLDPHAGQLAVAPGKATECQRCHDLSSFTKVRFDHQKDSRYPLTGKHATAACASCHRAAQTASVPVARYKPLETACASCHLDPHVGQLAQGGAAGDRATDCARCHETADWKTTLFRHAPPFTDYALTGRHAKVACAKCHLEVPLGQGATARRYKPLPRNCEACHADFHKGAFQGFEP
jgi:hypothetical protein